MPAFTHLSFLGRALLQLVLTVLITERKCAVGLYGAQRALA